MQESLKQLSSFPCWSYRPICTETQQALFKARRQLIEPFHSKSKGGNPACNLRQVLEGKSREVDFKLTCKAIESIPS